MADPAAVRPNTPYLHHYVLDAMLTTGMRDEALARCAAIGAPWSRAEWTHSGKCSILPIRRLPLWRYSRQQLLPRLELHADLFSAHPQTGAPLGE
jgi:hypothetical protein